MSGRMACPFARFGCNAVFYDTQENAHFADNLAAHFRMVLDANARLEAQVADLNAALGRHQQQPQPSQPATAATPRSLARPSTAATGVPGSSAFYHTGKRHVWAPDDDIFGNPSFELWQCCNRSGPIGRVAGCTPVPPSFPAATAAAAAAAAGTTAAATAATGSVASTPRAQPAVAAAAPTPKNTASLPPRAPTPKAAVPVAATPKSNSVNTNSSSTSADVPALPAFVASQPPPFAGISKIANGSVIVPTAPLTPRRMAPDAGASVAAFSPRANGVATGGASNGPAPAAAIPKATPAPPAAEPAPAPVPAPVRAPTPKASAAPAEPVAASAATPKAAAAAVTTPTAAAVAAASGAATGSSASTSASASAPAPAPATAVSAEEAAALQQHQALLSSVFATHGSGGGMTAAAFVEFLTAYHIVPDHCTEPDARAAFDASGNGSGGAVGDYAAFCGALTRLNIETDNASDSALDRLRSLLAFLQGTFDAANAPAAST